MVVDLPAPLRPSSAVACPAYAWTSMPATASTSPKRTCRPRTSTTGSFTRKVSQRPADFALGTSRKWGRSRGTTALVARRPLVQEQQRVRRSGLGVGHGAVHDHPLHVGAGEPVRPHVLLRELALRLAVRQVGGHEHPAPLAEHA